MERRRLQHDRRDDGPTLNCAIGPSCPTACKDCYNWFDRNNLIDAETFLAFTALAKSMGITQVTLSGGAPLSHPQHQEILEGLQEQDIYIKVDEVGTALLDEGELEQAAITLYPKQLTIINLPNPKIVQRVSADRVLPYADQWNLTRDGSNNDIIKNIRQGRPNLSTETTIVAKKIRAANKPLGINTVVSKHNIDDLPAIHQQVADDDASEWQLFQFDPYGPNRKFSGAHPLALTHKEFIEATAQFKSNDTLRVAAKALCNRDNDAYLMMDNGGTLWTPGHKIDHATNIRQRIEKGNIITSREVAVAALEQHIRRHYDKRSITSKVRRLYPTTRGEFARSG